MSRMNREQLLEAAATNMEATPDPSGKADLVSEKGAIIAAGEAGEMKQAFKRIKKVDGYRWVIINREDLFAANSLSIGSKAGIITPEGAVLKNADIPRKKP